jgi:RHS repeat-associated protein
MQEQTSQRVDYYYDGNPLNGDYSQNAWGRLAAVTFQDPNVGGSQFAYMYSYNQAGRVTAQHMSYNSDLVGFDATYGWDTEGRMTSINYGPQYQMTYDANGRLGGMSGSDLSLTASYGVAGEMLGFSYGGSTYFDHYSETRTYNAMLQLTRATVTGTSFSTQYTSQTAMDMQYIYTAGQNNGRIVQAIDGVAGETVNYTYDALNRLATAGATNATWGQAFAYDGFGNLTGKTVTQGSAPTLSVSFDPLTNHQNGQSYDANGNPTGMYLRYDVENRMTQGPGGYYAYDHAGKRVKKTVTGAEEFYFYGINGKRLATTVCTGEDDGTGCQPRVYDVYFGGKLVKSRGAVVATDRLGSVRASSTGDQMTYYPYGEERTSTADGRDKFGTYMRDSVTQDYADQRYYAVGMGRFGTPDPSGAKSSKTGSPMSWNRYIYTYGDPVNMVDVTGAATCLEYGDPYECSDGAGSGGGSNDMETVDDQSKQKERTGGASPSKVTSASSALTQLELTIGMLGIQCTKVLPSAVVLVKDAGQLKFFDARPSADGDKSVGQIAPALAAYNPANTLQNIVGGDNAVTLNGANGSISSTILLGKQFFLDDVYGNNANYSVGQTTVLLHELLHYATQLGDDAFASKYGIKAQQYETNSSAINRWLQNDCKN